VQPLQQYIIMESHVLIRVKTIDNKITEFQLNLQKNVLDLKKAIEEVGFSSLS
jgi:hypothetical protein